MSQRRLQSWIWWLLPLIVARALLPVGFMPAATGDGMQLVICANGFTKVIGQGAHDSSSSESSSLSCPFAHAAAAPLPPTVPVLLQVFLALLTVRILASQHVPVSRPPRSQLTRGPPVFS